VLDVPYANIKNIGEVFFYLYHNGKRVSYARDHMSHFVNPGDQPTKLKWIHLRADRACGRVKDDFKAGIISVMLSIVDITSLSIINFKEQDRIAYNLKKGGAVLGCSSEEEEQKLLNQESSEEEPDYFNMPLQKSQRRTLGVQGGMGDKLNPWKDLFTWFDKSGRKRLNTEKLRIHIFQCRNLSSADKNGLSDPFVLVHDDG